MKRFHVHVSVKDIPASIRFYTTLFSAQPPPARARFTVTMRALSSAATTS